VKHVLRFLCHSNLLSSGVPSILSDVQSQAHIVSRQERSEPTIEKTVATTQIVEQAQHADASIRGHCSQQQFAAIVGFDIQRTATGFHNRPALP
jgi:hypothetical protein